MALSNAEIVLVEGTFVVKCTGLRWAEQRYTEVETRTARRANRYATHRVRVISLSSGRIFLACGVGIAGSSIFDVENVVLAERCLLGFHSW